ncbi:hypothetical protein QTO12_18585 [Vibrio owensii]|uniref:hypothetical protein n=1 Tax=Vibrio owensii TaxID=696485 RepID=UPI002F425D70
MFLSNKKRLITLSVALMLAGCGTDDTSANSKDDTSAHAKPLAFNLTTITASSSDKATTFTWEASDNATEYSLCRKDLSKPKSCDVLEITTTTSAIVNGIGVIKHLTSEYFVIAKNSFGEIASNERFLRPQELTPLIQHIDASNTVKDDDFGISIALSSDGNTLAVGATGEDSNGTGVNSEAQANNDASHSGAVYIFRYSDYKWTQEAYLKASNAGEGDAFGGAISLSSDGNTLAVGAHGEDSNGLGVNSGEQADNYGEDSGAVYIFRYNDSEWTQEAYIKSSHASLGHWFGGDISLSADGNTLAVGASRESSDGVGINSEVVWDIGARDSGAVYLFRYIDSSWTQEAYIKASNTGEHDFFGGSVALSSDGNTLAVGASGESSDGTGVNSGAQENDNALKSGAVYLFRYSDSKWTQEAYLKASNAGVGDHFGGSVALSSDGNTLAAGASGESSDGSGVYVEALSNNNARYTGALYIFRFSDSIWTQEAYIKASNTDVGRYFGSNIALSSDGKALAVGVPYENSGGVGVNSEDQENNDFRASGAAYLFRYSDSKWTQEAYLKASNTHEFNYFGGAVALSSDGKALAVGAPHYWSADNSDGQGDDSRPVYFY